MLEARKIGGGSTSDSTGNLYTTVDHGFRSIESKYGDEETKKVISSRNIAVDWIESNILRHKMDCDFKRVPMFIFSADDENSSIISDEFRTVLEAGSKVLSMDDEVILKTTLNIIKARYVVHATHTPKGDVLKYHTVLGPYGEYSIAVILQSEGFPEGIFWGYFDQR